MILLGLGSNLGDRAAMLREAIRRLSERLGSPVAVSSFLETEPVDFVSSHRFLNAAVAFEASMEPFALLDFTQEIERDLGRSRKSENGEHFDRTIDIDILFLGDTVLSSERLTIPHPHIASRRFVLEPLAEIAPDFVHPVLHRSLHAMAYAPLAPRVFRLSAKMLSGGASAADLRPANLTDAVNRLLPQLTAHPVLHTPDSLRRLVANGCTEVWFIEDDANGICGMASLCLCTSPTGRKAWIEDVVTDESVRRRGYGKLLLLQLIRRARLRKAKGVYLTSRPERVAANTLYRSLGFEPRETNVYCMKF
ncbi:MAG: 2-amino-4-hydroxy-6-hydroxymethyldihydropteridine diphosphokinase [Alloprevotella sp.]